MENQHPKTIGTYNQNTQKNTKCIFQSKRPQYPSLFFLNALSCLEITNSNKLRGELTEATCTETVKIQA